MSKKVTRLVTIGPNKSIKVIKKSKLNGISNTAKATNKPFIYKNEILTATKPYFPGCESILLSGLNGGTFITKTTHGHYKTEVSHGVFKQVLRWSTYMIEDNYEKYKSYWTNLETGEGAPKQTLVDFIIQASIVNKNYYEDVPDIEAAIDDADEQLQNWLTEQFELYRLCKTQKVRDTFLKGLSEYTFKHK